MSMRNYAVNDYGLLMTRETLKMIASKVCKGYTEEEYREDEFAFYEELYDRGIVDYISGFTGESIYVYDDGRNCWGVSECYRGDDIWYVPTRHISTLFNAAYKDMNEIVEEFRDRLGEYLPRDFDYRNYIRNISGTYYG